MSYASQVLGGQTVTKKIRNKYAVAGFTATAIDDFNTAGAGEAISVNSGALTAGVLSTIFSATGGGVVMPLLTVSTKDTTSRTLRVVVEVDGDTVTPAFDYTSATITTNDTGVCLAGSSRGGFTIQLEPIRSSSSLVVKVASSLNETDKFRIQYHFQEVL